MVHPMTARGKRYYILERSGVMYGWMDDGMMHDEEWTEK